MDLTTTNQRSLEDRLDAHADAWRPEPGAKLVGVVIDVDNRTTEHGTYPIVTVLSDNGDELAIHAFHTVLRNEFSKRQPRLGERLGVKYLGPTEKGYEGYRVVWEQVEPPDSTQNSAGTQLEVAEHDPGDSEPADDETNWRSRLANEPDLVEEVA